MSTYKAGTTSLNILLSVNVVTIGIAATRVSKRQTGSASGGIAVAHSVDASGDIINTPLGSAVSLNGNTLTIATLVNLFGDLDDRQREFQQLSVDYSLSGGDDGNVPFPAPDLKLHSADYSRVTLVKNISLIP
jgi:hypothetical protein